MSIKELFEQKKYEEVLDAFEKLPIDQFKEEFIKFVNELYEQNKIDVFEVLHNELSEAQWKRFLWLDSSEREKECLLQKKDFTEEDYENLKACDF